MQTGSDRHVPGLDGIRAVAAYGVIFTHVGFQSGAALQHNLTGPILARLDFGVTLFFILSGYLLSRPFCAAYLSGRSAPRTRAFWWRRAVRIFPAYLVVVVIALGLLAKESVTLKTWLSYLLMVQTYSGANSASGLQQMWTLAVEISFYAVLPPLFACVRRLWPRASEGPVLGLLAGLVAVSLTFSLVMRGSDQLIGLLWLPAYLDWFALGMLLALASCPQAKGSRWVAALTDLASAAGTCWLVGLTLFALSTLPLAGPQDLSPTTDWQWVLKHLLYGTAAFMFVLPVVLGRIAWVEDVLGHPVMSWLGRISYGVYLWHLALLIAIQRWIGWPVFGGHFLPLLILTVLSATALAALSWHLLERPLLRRFTHGWRRQESDQQSTQRSKA